MQLGIGRSGFYSYTWLENLLLAGIHNDFRLRPDVQISAPGTFVRSVQFGKETPGMNGWKMEPYEAGRYFYLSPGWGPFVLEPDGQGGTRFLVRSLRGPASPVASFLLDFTFDPIHGTMEKRTMASIKALAEGRRPFSAFWTAVATLGFLAAALLASGAILVQPKKKWWILLPSVYSLVVLALTRDLKAALVAQVALGTIVAFFAVLGRRAWASMVFFWVYAFAVLIWAKDAYVVFGLTLFLPELALLSGRGAGKPVRSAKKA